MMRPPLFSSPDTSYRLLTAAILAAVTVPRMTQLGMFSDGILYATIARNLSVGIGTVWAPSFTQTLMPAFFEHPPLGFALEGAAFWMLGDHPATERLFSLLVFGLHAVVIAMIWRRVHSAALDWLPALFWIVPSIVTWSAINNMLENTQALFTSTAVLLVLIAGQQPRAGAVVLASVASAAAAVAAALVKGPVGAFPLAAPLLFLLLPADRRPVRTWLIISSMVAALALLVTTLWLYEPSRAALSEYLRTQVLPSLDGRREGLSGGAGLTRHLVFGVLLRMVVLAALFRVVSRRWAVDARDARAALCFLAIALSASLPIGASARLAGHYLLPSVPFFALACASLTRGTVRFAEQVSPLRRALPLALAAVLLAATIAVPLTIGSLERRDVDLLRDVTAVGPALPRDAVVGACKASEAAWSLHAYMHRLYRVSLATTDAPAGGWLLQADGACAPASDCQPTAAGTSLVLFRCGPVIP